MTRRKKEYYAPLGLWIFAIVIITVLGCYLFSLRMPYLFHQEVILGRFYMIFPATWMFFIYFIFFHKWKVINKTGFQMQHSKAELIAPRSKIKRYLHVLFWSGFFAAFLAWATWGVSACMAYLYSKQPVTQEFVINNLRGAGNAGVDIGLVDKADGVQYYLKQPGYLSLGVPWDIGDSVCAKGRTSFLGTIVEDFRVGTCK